MEAEQFSLCWNNFHNNLRTGFHSLLQDEDLVDVTLAAEGRYLKAHKTVLSICSPYFKELFRVNPCKHPIVILQDVNYFALKSLLQFMYQGEVSVGQDEIPTFMRVAEMLKVKGLTDNDSNTESSNSPSGTNGVDSGSRNSPYMYGSPDARQLMKRTKPGKKLLRPIQHLRPIDSPKTIKSSPLLRSPQHTSSPHQSFKKQCMDVPEHPIHPKQEPIDPNDDDDFRDQYDESLDMSSMLDTTLSESSLPSGSWTPDLKMCTDTSSPGGLHFLKSRKGHPVLINNGHIYTLNHKQEDRSIWYCVKRRVLNCEGCLITMNGPTLLSYSGHNHAQLNDVIQRLQAYSATSTS